MHRIMEAVSGLRAAVAGAADANPVFLSTAEKRAAILDLVRVKSQVTELLLRIEAAAADVAEEECARDVGAVLVASGAYDPPHARREYELSRALRAGGRRVDVVPQLVAATGVLLAGASGEFWISWVVLIVAVSFIAVWRMIAQMVVKDGRTYGDVLSDVVVGAFVQVYVPFLTSIAIMLLFRENGQWWVLSFVAIAVAADTCAYAAGLAFGKHPMAPRISPKKTWEGFGGAVLGSLIAGVLLATYLLHLQWWCGLVLGAVILLSATLGDLGESMLKRDLGIKDMSSWLPGHGGLLDRLDSILPSTIPALALSYLLAPWMVS